MALFLLSYVMLPHENFSNTLLIQTKSLFGLGLLLVEINSLIAMYVTTYVVAETIYSWLPLYAVQYEMIFHTALHWLKLNMNESVK